LFGFLAGHASKVRIAMITPFLVIVRSSSLVSSAGENDVVEGAFIVFNQTCSVLHTDHIQPSSDASIAFAMAGESKKDTKQTGTTIPAVARMASLSNTRKDSLPTCNHPKLILPDQDF
jgi:hypothetical protein